MGEMEVKRENERKEMRVWSNSKFLGNSVQQKRIRNYYPEILYSTKVQLVKSLAAITFVRLRYSRSQLERLIVQRLILKETRVRPNSECLGNNNSVQQKMIRNCHSGILQSKFSQKLCCNKLCEVTVLKELVDGTLERDFTKATHASV